MKFYGVGIVWNPQADKALCKFEKGELDTEDTEIISKLVNLGYAYEGTTLEVTELGDTEPKYIEGMPKIEPYTEETTESDTLVAEEIELVKNENFFDDFTDEELKSMAKDRGIKGFGIMKREKLISKLKEE